MVATPIGNLEDITLRALEVLKNVEVIACEDTRQTAKLLSHYGIKKKLLSYFEHNKIKRSLQLIELLKDNKSVALVSDAGTPAISDPGFFITRAAVEEGLKVSPLPGASALTAALSVSGITADKFFFEGFLPPKQTARKNRLRLLKNEKHTLVFYESKYRLVKTLLDIKDVFGDINICVCRELTKIYEEIKKGAVSELLGYFNDEKLRGEFVVIIPNFQREKRSSDVIKIG